jgi:hypothetical protein
LSNARFGWHQPTGRSYLWNASHTHFVNDGLLQACGIVWIIHGIKGRDEFVIAHCRSYCGVFQVIVHNAIFPP